MAITTLNGLVAGLKASQDVVKASFTGEAAGQYHSSWYLAGMPGAGAVVTPGVSGVSLVGPNVSGQIAFPATVAGQNVYLARMDAVQSANIGAVILADRLWQNSGLSPTATTAQTVGSTTWDRDNVFDGSFTGDGVQVAIEVTTTLTNGSPITSGITISYTNEAGTAGRTGTLVTLPQTSLAGTIVPFTLQAGDRGVRSIQTITHPTLTGGAYSLIAFRQVVSLGTPLANVAVQQDGLSLGLPRMHDESVPFLIFLLTGTAAGVTDCGITWAQG